MATDTADFARTETVQVVIIGESFDNNFDPITREKPKLLLNVINTPIIDLILDWLQRNGVQEVILYIRRKFTSAVKKHCMELFNRRKWSNMSLRIVSSDKIHSLGDVMRDLYTKSLVSGHFLLMNGDSVANFDVKKIIDIHKENCKNDVNTAMTLLYTPEDVSVTERLEQEYFSDEQMDEKLLNRANHVRDLFTRGMRPKFPRIIDVLPEEQPSWMPTGDEPKTEYTLGPTLRATTVTDLKGKILSLSNCRYGQRMEFLTYLAHAHSKVIINPHLSDPCFCVCSQNVLMLYSDHFDYQTRDGLVKSLIDPEDLNNCSVYQYVLTNHYATNVTTWIDYERVSRDIIERKLHPMVPDMSITSRRYRYQYCPYTGHYWTNSSTSIMGSDLTVNLNTPSDQLTVMDDQHKLALKSKQCSTVVLGEAVEVHCSAAVRSSSFGNHCRIGSNSEVSNSYVLDNCIIHNNCKISRCFLSTNVTVLENTVLGEGCVVSAGVTLGPNLIVPPATLVATKNLWRDLPDADLLGPAAKISVNGYVFPRNVGAFPNKFDGDVTGLDDEFSCVIDSTLNKSGLSDASAGDCDVSITIAAVDVEDMKQLSTGVTALVAHSLYKDILLPVWGLALDDRVDVQETGSDETVSEADVVDGMQLDDDEIEEIEFRKEVLVTLRRGMVNNAEAGQLRVEINGSRFAHNVSVEILQHAVLSSVLRCYHNNDEDAVVSGDDWPSWNVMKKGLHKNRPILTTYFDDSTYLDTLERLVESSPTVLPYMNKVLYELSQELELLDDEKLQHWFAAGGIKRGGEPSDAYKKFKLQVAPFLKWLQEAEEETSSDE